MRPLSNLLHYRKPNKRLKVDILFLRGFRSSEIAELMMRRAKKMKYNPARRKKLLGKVADLLFHHPCHYPCLFNSFLISLVTSTVVFHEDPNKRLALFKKLEETNKLRDVKPPPTRRQPPNRVDYFAGENCRH